MNRAVRWREIWLEATEAVRVQLRGEALRVHCRSTAARDVPLRQIAHVVVIGNVSLDAEVQAVLPESGITVAFCDGHGRCRGMLVPARLPRPHLFGRCLELRERPDGARRQHDWRRAALRRAMRRVLGAAAVEGARLRPRKRLQSVDRNLCLRGGPRMPGAIARLQARAHVEARLAVLRAGYPWHAVGGTQVPVPIVADVSAVLSWHLRGLLRAEPDLALRQLARANHALGWYGEHRRELALRARHVIADFELFVLELRPFP